MNNFTMVEENFESRALKCFTMRDSHPESIASPWLKKILNLNARKCLKMNDFHKSF